MNHFSLHVQTFELIINNNQYNITICWFSDIVTFPNNFLIILTSGLFRSHLPKPGVDTETSRYPSHWSGCPIGSSETHAGSGSQCWDDDAKPQWNHPECECQTVKKPLLFVSCVTDDWSVSALPDDSSECGLYPDLQRLRWQLGGVGGYEHKGDSVFLSVHFLGLLEAILGKHRTSKK